MDMVNLFFTFLDYFYTFMYRSKPLKAAQFRQRRLKVKLLDDLHKFPGSQRQVNLKSQQSGNSFNTASQRIIHAHLVGLF
ncbi:hypothetical protein ACHQM5_021529 [Ranunculus cassubicifolius]